MEVWTKYLEKQMHKVTKQQISAFGGAMIAGTISHGYVFANSLLYHDGILAVHTQGTTFPLGRWGLGILEWILTYTVGEYSNSMFNGMMSLFLIAVSSMLIVELLHLTQKLDAIYTGVIMAIFPVVTSIFAFMYTAPAYWIALFCNIFAVYVVCKHKKYVWGIVLLAIALGLYQAFFAVAISVFLLSMITDSIEGKWNSFREIIGCGLKYVMIMIGGLALYLLVNAAAVKVLKISMSSYQGTDQMGKLEIKEIPHLLWRTYDQFGLNVNWSGINNALILRLAIWGIILITVFLFVIIICRGEQNNSNKVGLLLLFCLTPMAFNGAYLFSTNASYSVHTLMRYSLVFALIIPLVPLEYLEGKRLLRGKLHVFVAEIILPLLLCGVSGCYIYNNNVAYMKENFLQEQAISYYTVLISEIKGTDGYNDDLPIAYIGERNIEDKSVTMWPQFERVQITGYEGNASDLLNDYAWRVYVGRHCGFYPKVLEDTTEIERLTEVKEMPCYPDKGSIKVVNGAVVVKFAEADIP